MIRQKKELLNSRRKSTAGLFKLTLISDTHIILAADKDPDFTDLGNRLVHTALTKLQKFVSSVINSNSKPNCVLNLGDIINGGLDRDPDIDASFQAYNDLWEQLPTEIVKRNTAGNHDYAVRTPIDLTLHEYVSEKLGYGASDVIAGSKMNEIFIISNDVVDVRFINLDTNKNEFGEFSTQGGFVMQDALDWLFNAIVESTESVVVVFTHYFKPHMPISEVANIEAVFRNAKANRPDINIVLLSGHTHPQSLVVDKPNGMSYEWYNIPALVDNLTSFSVDIFLNKKGVSSVEINKWSYP